jgi:hypothetical protein
MASAHWALSPAVGLALAQDAGLWSNLRAASESRADSFSRLLRSLFFAPCHKAPIRRTRNESLPAAHLSPELLGHLAGLGLLTSAPADTIHARLRALGISPLAKRTGVSIARFVSLALDFRAAADADGHAHELGLIAQPAHALASTFAWELCDTARTSCAPSSRSTNTGRSSPPSLPPAPNGGVRGSSSSLSRRR